MTLDRSTGLARHNTAFDKTAAKTAESNLEAFPGKKLALGSFEGGPGFSAEDAINKKPGVRSDTTRSEGTPIIVSFADRQISELA